MPLIRTEQNSLIGGVSQQPDALRLSNQAAAATNCWMSPVDGLTRRMPTRFTADLGVPAATEKYHAIIRDDSEKYQFIFTPTGVQGWNMDTGNAVTITDNAPTNYDYLNGFTEEDELRVLTVADSTFVVNTTRTVTKDGAVIGGAKEEAMVFVRAGNYDTEYTVEIEDGSGVVIVASVFTWADPASIQNPATYVVHPLAGTAPYDINEGTIATDQIALALKAELLTQIGLSASVGSWTITHRAGTSTLHIDVTGETIAGMSAGDSVGDSTLSVVHKEVPRVEGFLPTVARHDYNVLVVGDAEVDADNYNVRFVADKPSQIVSTGHWQEAGIPGEQLSFDLENMPHRLVNTGVDTFDWEEIPFADRNTGDDDTNPWPEFTDKTISNLFFYKNRLGFLSENTVSMSETGEFFTFFRTTLLTLRDTAPISIQSNHTRVSLFKTSAAYNEDLILFSELGQFALKGGDILSPRTVELLPVSEYESSTQVNPVSTGKSVFFPFQRGSTSGIRELFRLNDLTTYDANDTTVQVPNYISGAPRHIVGSTLENVLLVTTQGQVPADITERRNVCWVYQYLWSGQEKVQAAWHKWDFGGSAASEVLDISFFQNTIYLLLLRNGNRVMEYMTLATGLADESVDWLVHLDGRVHSDDYVSMVYDAGADETTITMPYNTNNSEVGVVDTLTGLSRNVVSNIGDQVIVTGDITGPADTTYAGLKYETSYDFTLPLVKEQTKSGAQVAYSNVPQQVRYGHLGYHDTKHFWVDTTIGARATRTTEFTGLNCDFAHLTLDNIELHDGTFRFAVMGTASNAVVTLRTDTPYPFNITHASWEINYRPRATKFRG